MTSSRTATQYCNHHPFIHITMSSVDTKPAVTPETKLEAGDNSSNKASDEAATTAAQAGEEEDATAETSTTNTAPQVVVEEDETLQQGQGNTTTTTDAKKRKLEDTTSQPGSTTSRMDPEKAAKARKLVHKDMLKRIGVKPAMSAYFVFADALRPQLRKEFPGESVGTLGKRLGDKWRELSPADKQPYEQKAAQDRARVEREVEAWIQQQGGYDKVVQQLAQVKKKHNNGDGNATALAYPSARIRRICKLDPEVRGLSKEALLLVTKAAELATVKLGLESVRVAQIQNRRKLLPDDVAMVCRSREQFTFLKQDVLDLVREQQQQQQQQEGNENNSSSNNNKKNGKAKATEPKTSNPISSYFAPKSSKSD